MDSGKLVRIIVDNFPRPMLSFCFHDGTFPLWCRGIVSKDEFLERNPMIAHVVFRPELHPGAHPIRSTRRSTLEQTPLARGCTESHCWAIGILVS